MKLILALIFIITSLNALAAKPTIDVQKYTIVKNKKSVYLGDIINAQGINARLNKKIKELKLSDAPQVGERRVFSSQAISQLLRRHIRGERVSLKIPRHIIIENPVSSITKEQVEKKFTAEIKKYCDACYVSISNLKLPQVPEHLRAAEWKIAEITNVPAGSFSHLLQVRDKGDYKNFWITGVVQIKKNVPVLRRTLFIGQVVEKEDFEYKLRDVTFIRKGVPKTKELIGKVLRRSLRADEIIWSDVLDKQKAFLRGDIVQLVSGNEDWEVLTTVIAQQDGFLGQFAKVMNSKTKKMIMAKVIDKNKVEIQ